MANDTSLVRLLHDSPSAKEAIRTLRMYGWVQPHGPLTERAIECLWANHVRRDAAGLGRHCCSCTRWAKLEKQPEPKDEYVKVGTCSFCGERQTFSYDTCEHWKGTCWDDQYETD